MARLVGTFDPDRVVRALNGRRRPALVQAAEAVLAKAEPLTPRDTGALIGSADIVVEGGADSEAVIRYSSPYAVVQHEDLTFNHPGGGGPKFLELAIAQSRRQALAAIRDGLMG